MGSRKILTPVLFALTLAAPLGCDDDGDDHIDDRDAQLGWTAMNHAVASGHDGFATHVAIATDGDFEVGCEGGGTVHLDGRMDEPNSFRLDVDFDGCVDDDVTIDGAVTLVARVDVDVDIDTSDDDQDGDDDHAGAAVVVDYDGLLIFDGDIEGSCSIDASVRAGAVVFDGFAAAGVSVEGHICDNDADDVLDDDVDDDGV